ncbi:Mif2/CENP-C like-domain-containing protein [Cryomyces antarcticus]|uniref:Mitotic fidelity of chromosome transmission-protein n=1 Tax=Cryomyces antarcticus TaxID=329879 RepID=A0ABR0LPL3_9PEZI|nr:mitotic fidelity of chromosome transmission-related protein [Cryomyces antarcticus]KAK5018272.1 mitotic fidelity of chromosome transmission-related protein [Cryomyces antarcticus]KAK5201511.1 mitotic fidelity of chromosome transmission- protein [Cryomyces antarcticus]
MAPANTPGRKTRENNYFEVGIGRKTGITLKDTGVRDEHGIEPIDGIFSSPAKSPPKNYGRNGNTTIVSSESMEFAESSAPEPTETLTARRLQHNRGTQLPPRLGRSPIKTSLGASPRRQSSMGPPTRGGNSLSTPQGRAASHPAVARRLDFSMNDAALSVERSLRNPSSTRKSSALKQQKNVYDYESSPEKERTKTLTELEMEDVMGIENDETELPQGNGKYDGNPALENDYDIASSLLEGDDFVQVTQDDPTDIAPEPSKMPPPKKPRGRPRKSDISISSLQEDSGAEAARKTGNKPDAQKRGRPVRDIVPRSEPADETESSGLKESTATVPAAKRRGRPPKNKLLAVSKGNVAPATDASVADLTEEAEDQERPAKRARRTLSPAPVKGNSEGKLAKPPPSQRDPNAKIRSATTGEKVLQSKATRSVRRDPNEPDLLGNRRFRQETPFDVRGATMTRSGRVVMEPLKHWLGEKYVYERAEPVAVQRVEVVETPKKGRRKGKQSRKVNVEDEDDEDPNIEEPWESQGQIVSGRVGLWDAGRDAVGDEEIVTELAFSNRSIQTREVADATFRFAKIMTLSFFGCGMVELPPYAAKKLKNSRKMHMVFFVHAGRVTVQVAESVFSLGKGGVWQVPRGNVYGITNESDRTAKIFFAQGNETE